MQKSLINFFSATKKVDVSLRLEFKKLCLSLEGLLQKRFGWHVPLHQVSDENLDIVEADDEMPVIVDENEAFV